MQQLVLNIEDESKLPNILESLKCLDGVSIDETKTRRKSKFELGMEESIADIEAGRCTRWANSDEYLKSLGLR